MFIEDSTPFPQLVSILASTIPIGTVFTGFLGGYTGAFLRTFSGIVFLNDSMRTWNNNQIDVCEVKDYVVRIAKVVLL